MKVLLLYLQTQKNSQYNLSFIKSFKLNYMIYLRDNNQKNNIENIYYYNDIYFNFNIISNKLKEYDYILYFDDNWKYNLNVNNCIKLSKEILESNNKLDQVIFNDLTSKFIEKKINNIDVKIPIVNIKELDHYNIFERINDVVLDKFNPYPKSNLKEMDYVNYLNKQYPVLNFKLLPSLIRCKKILLENDLLKNDHFEYIFSNKMEKYNFKTCYLKCDLNKIENKIENNKSIIDNTRGDNITLVTGFIKLDIIRPSKRSSQKYDYIEKSKDTLSIDQNMVIYISRELVDIVKNYRDKLNLLHKTKIIEVTKKDLYLYDKIDIIKNNVTKNWKPYDIPEYIMAVNSRYNFVKNAIENNYFQTDFFAWIDFAAGHTVTIPKLVKMTYSYIDKIRIGWIARKKKDNFVYNHKCFGGGIFIGHKTIMLEFIKIHDIEFKKIMNMGYCINDDKLLFLIFEKYPNLFDYYFSSYSTLLLKSN